MRPSRRNVLAAAALILLILTGACASKPFLVVHYQMPSPSDLLEGQKVYPVIADIRDTKAFLSENAQKSLRDFNETYSLVALKEDGSGNLLGVYNIEALLSEIFKQRLINLGAQVPPEWGLDFTLALTFIALAVPAINDRPSLFAAASAGATALLAWNLPYKLGLIAAALVGIAVGLWSEKR